MAGAWAAFAGVQFALLIVCVHLLLRHYAVKNTPWIAWITVFISWYLGFFGTLFLPIDIAEAYTSFYTNVSNISVPEPARNISNTSRSLRSAALTHIDIYTHTHAEPHALLHAAQGGASRWLQSNGSSAGNGTAANGTSTWVIESDEIQIRNGPLESLWVAVYWCTALLTYIVIPAVQEFVAAGEFRVRDRWITSIKVNAYFYLGIGVVALIALGVVIGYGWSLWELLPILISLANTYGLLLIVLLMGYGTSEVPRSLWRKARPADELRQLQFTATEVEGQLFDARAALNDVIAQVKSLQTKINALSNDREVQSGDGAKEYAELQHCMEIVLAKCVVDYHVSTISSSGITGEDDEAAAAKAAKKGWRKSKVTMNKLAALHKRLMQAKAKVGKQRFRWERHVLRAIELEYVLAKTAPPLPVITKTVRRERGGSLFGVASAGDAEHTQPDDLQLITTQALAALSYLPNMCGGAPNRLLWHFRIRFAPATYVLLAFIAEVMSLLLLWSEATIWINLQGLAPSNLSVFGLLLQAADQTGGHSYAAIQIAAAIPLVYMCITSAYALWKLKLFDFLDMSGNQNTDPYCLCFNATLFNRLQFSLAFNYLNVLMHSNNKSDFPDSAFLHSVGAKMKLSQLDWYIPILMVIVYILARLNIFERIMRLMGVDEKGQPVRGNIKHDEMIADGKKLIEKTKRALGLGSISGDTSSSNDAPSAMDKLRAMGRAGIAASSGDVEMARVGAASVPYEPPAGGGRRPAGGTAKSGMMSLDAFAKSGPSSRQPAAAPAPAAASTLPSWDFDSPGTRFDASSSSSRAPAPAPSTSYAPSAPVRAPAPAPSSFASSAPPAAPASSLTSFAAAPAGPKPNNLASLLRGKRGAGYGQLE